MSSNGTTNGTPKWAKQWATFYGARQAHAFIFHFNIYDLHQGRTVKEYLTSTLAQSTRSGQPLDCVIVYNRATGFEFPTETMREAFIKAAGLKREGGAKPVDPILGALGIGNQDSEELPTAPGQALPLIDKVLRSDLLAAVVVEYAELLVPQSAAGQMSVEDRNSLAILHRWGGDRELAAAGQTVCLLTASLPALSTDLRAASSRYETIKVDLPKQAERLAYIGALRSATEDDDDGVSRLLFTAAWQVQPEYFARVTAGLGLIHIRDILYRAEQEGELTAGLIKERKDRIISSEYADVLEMIEPKYGWERIGGLAHVKDFFARNVIRPMQEGRYNRVPMGVLMTGPAGTGKSAVAVAVAKEAGINAVELKMSRILGKFVGDSERNLETALSAIESLSPTIVFMDEIDQTLRRGESGDSGVGSRVFSRLLEFMADTSHRGKIVFLAATNRPDLIDAALRRPGRFDRKIPFLVPDGEEREAIFRVMARTYGLDADLDVPAEAISRTENWTGAEIEAAIIKAAELMEDDGMSAPAAVAEAARRLRPSTAQIDFMTKLALAECNDPDLLPERYRRSLDDRPQLEEEIAQTRKRGERGRELNLG